MNNHRNQIFTVHYCAGPLPFHVNRKTANIRKRCESSTKCIVLFDAKAVKSARGGALIVSTSFDVCYISFIRMVCTMTKERDQIKRIKDHDKSKF